MRGFWGKVMNAPITSFTPTAPEDVAWLGTGPVPAAAYYDPIWYADEISAIFKQNWLQIGHICEVPDRGSFIRRELEFAAASLLIVRGADDVVRAFHNVCTHRGTQLVAAECGRVKTFSCRYHMWTYDGDGRLLSAPDFEQFGLDKADCGLPQVACEVVAGMIFVNLAKQPVQGLREYLGDLAMRMEQLPIARATTFSEYHYEIDANWKLTYDNFQENYHLRFIHSRSGAAAFAPENPFGYPAAFGFHGEHRTQTLWSNPNPEIKQLQTLGFMRGFAALVAKGVVPSDGSNASGSRDYFALFPNFFLLGTPAQHFSHSVYPLGPEKSRGVIRLYWVGADSTPSERYAREYSMATARDIHAEDRGVITAGQRGLSSGALAHIHFQAQEALCRHLYNGVAARVNAWRVKKGDVG
jgi:phenylpropionate dioxygenase-like ring-hydroxylating dioxygenase large terminal subunit